MRFRFLTGLLCYLRKSFSGVFIAEVPEFLENMELQLWSTFMSRRPLLSTVDTETTSLAICAKSRQLVVDRGPPLITLFLGAHRRRTLEFQRRSRLGVWRARRGGMKRRWSVLALDGQNAILVRGFFLQQSKGASSIESRRSSNKYHCMNINVKTIHKPSKERERVSYLGL
jgi:hypothetical protein